MNFKGRLIWLTAHRSPLTAHRSPLTAHRSPLTAHRSTAQQLALKAAAEARGIKFLCHFTNADNFNSILEHGLAPRAELDKRGLAYSFNDDMRLDGKNAVCLSLMFPNYKMFWKYRQEDSAKKWVVLLLKPDLLWEKDCAFYPTNAANASVSGNATADMQTVAAFQEMFYEPEDGDSRAQRRLKEHEPTDPQAEILCFDKIDPSYILAIQAEGALFKGRHDYAYWKKAPEPEVNCIITFGVLE